MFVDKKYDFFLKNLTELIISEILRFEWNEKKDSDLALGLHTSFVYHAPSPKT